MRRGRGVAFDGPRVEALFEAGGGRIELSEVRTLVRACGGGQRHPRDLRDLQESICDSVPSPFPGGVKGWGGFRVVAV